MEDLQTYYSKKGINEYASRIGELCCLLIAIEVCDFKFIVKVIKSNGKHTYH